LDKIWIIGDGVELHTWDTDDAASLARLVQENQEHLGRFLPWARPGYGREDARAYIDLARNQIKEGSAWAWGIWADGTLSGGIGLNNIDWLNGTASIGYWISRDTEGRGVVTKACRAILDRAFKEMGLERVDIRAEPQNTRSRRVPERLGFKEEGTLRHVVHWPGPAGRFVDHVVYSILRDEWLDGDRPRGPSATRAGAR